MTEDASIRRQAYLNPDVRNSRLTHNKEWRQSPAGKLKLQQYERSEERKAKKRAYEQTPEAKAKRRGREQRPENRVKTRNAMLKRNYGLTPAEFEIMYFDQNGRCAICDDPFENEKQTHVDHCHGTGKVRELLCHRCNVGLGNARDDVKILQGMIDYLNRHSKTIGET